MPSLGQIKYKEAPHNGDSDNYKTTLPSASPVCRLQKLVLYGRVASRPMISRKAKSFQCGIVVAVFIIAINIRFLVTL